MKYAVYGVNRVAKDFLYIFDDLDVCYFFDDVYQGEFLGKAVFDIGDYLDKKNEFEKIIVCDFDKSTKEDVLNSMRLIRGEDYLFEEDFFPQLDTNVVNPDNKPVAIWGTGRAADKFLEHETKLNIKAFVDTFKVGKKYNDYVVQSPEIVYKDRSCFIIVAIRDNTDIIDKLEKQGYRRWIDYCTDEEYKARPSVMLKQTIFDRSCYNLECHTMLNHLEVGTDGLAICCCSTFISHSLGRLLDQPAKDIWNSNIHKIMCLSNVNKTYTFCKKDMCPFFIGRKTDGDMDLNAPYKKMTQSPTTVAVGFDSVCNLKCITCRDQYIRACDVNQQKLETIADRVRKELLPKCEFYISAGNGETLLSKQYRDLLISPEMKNVKYIRLLTNGMLFNESNWEKLRQATNAKIMMTVSIDAATKETYEKIRRGGNFDILKKNMEYAAYLRKTGELSYLRFNFVVQKENYEEMPMFVKWGKELGVDELFFTKILNWGTYTKEEFKEVSMMEEDGTTPKQELLEILKMPIMSEHIVDMGTIQYGRMNVEEGDKENYYRWELERKVDKLF